MSPIPVPLPSPTPEPISGIVKYLSVYYAVVNANPTVDTAALQELLRYVESNNLNPQYVGLVDFTQPSAVKRFSVINLITDAIAKYYVAHGIGSDLNGVAVRFSNTPGSDMSSLGFYQVAEEYTGDNGDSCRMDGKSSTNSNVRNRDIVIHGADYVSAAVVQEQGYLGRSDGCFAVERSVVSLIISQLKNSGVILAYYNGP